MFGEEDIQTIVKLGLNASQAKIYLTLISLGVANAKDITQASRIDHGEVYRQLETLQQKSLVEKILSAPTQYKPMPLNEALEILIQQKNQENTQTQQKAEAMLKKAGHEDRLREVAQRTSIIPMGNYRKKYTARLIENTQKEIMWYTQIERVPIATTFYAAAWTKAFARGARHRVIAELNGPTEETLKYIDKYKKENSNFEIRFAYPTLLVTFAIRDDNKLDFSTEKITGIANSQVLTTNNAQLIKVIKEFFELRWNTAMKEYLKKGKEQL